jgi:formate hydrogenlyase subunit 3/multisubunit Na+/H+ antiporter MnhD subunit
MGLMLGGLALAGFPLTAGFPTHWAVSQGDLHFTAEEAAELLNQTMGLALSGQQWVRIITSGTLLISSAGIVIGLLRGLGAMLGSETRDDVAGQPIIASALVLALAVLVITLGLYPHLFLEPIQSAVQAFSFF